VAVYTRPRDPDCPLVCLDETSKQFLAETRLPIPMKGTPGPLRLRVRAQRHRQHLHDVCTARRLAPLKVTDRYIAVDYAHVLKELADRYFDNAKTVVLVQDNLNIHGKGSLYEAFPATEATRLVWIGSRLLQRKECDVVQAGRCQGGLHPTAGRHQGARTRSL
jgi:hypothetical protein